jgi:hypothetical protein
MKMNSVFAAAALLMLALTSAQAQVTLSLDAPVALGGGVFQYGGSILNESGVEVYIDGVSFNVPDGVLFEGTLDDLILGDLPMTLQPNSFFNSNEFFRITVPSGFEGEGTYALLGGDFGDRVSNEVTFAISNPADVPEPGSVALLTGLAAGGLCLARRRRK